MEIKRQVVIKYLNRLTALDFKHHGGDHIKTSSSVLLLSILGQ